MNLYWLYDLSNFLFGILIIGFFVAVGVVGLYLTRRWVRRLHLVEHSHNDIVGFYLAAITVFYGITLGLVAVGTWETYSDVQTQSRPRSHLSRRPLPRHQRVPRSHSRASAKGSPQLCAAGDRRRLAYAAARHRAQQRQRRPVRFFKETLCPSNRPPNVRRF